MEINDELIMLNSCFCESSDKMCFERKYFGRFFVEKEEDIQKVIDIMKEIDDFEVSDYLPEDLITVFNPSNIRSVYTGKFDEIDMKTVMIKCWEKGIHCFIVKGKINENDDYCY